MGTNCAVHLANFFLFTYEFKYLQKQVFEKNFDRLHDLRLTGRYLDDVLTLDNPEFDSYKYDIYPEDMLTLNREDDGLPLHCLDLRIYYHEKDHCYATETHDKRDDPKFAKLPFTKYASADSFINSKIPYNIITTELHRFLNTNTHFSTFHTNCHRLLQTTQDRGYNLKQSLKRLRCFINAHLPLYNYSTPNRPYHNIVNTFRPSNNTTGELSL